MSSFREEGLHLVLHNDSIQPYLDMQLALKPKGLHFHLKSVDMDEDLRYVEGKDLHLRRHRSSWYCCSRKSPRRR